MSRRWWGCRHVYSAVYLSNSAASYVHARAYVCVFVCLCVCKCLSTMNGSTQQLTVHMRVRVLQGCAVVALLMMDTDDQICAAAPVNKQFSKAVGAARIRAGRPRCHDTNTSLLFHMGACNCTRINKLPALKCTTHARTPAHSRNPHPRP
jgi:hypothetical protein